MNASRTFWLSRSEVRELDRRAIDEFGVPSIVLMENAGRGVAVQMRRLNPEKRPVTILCGPGNNGGDGFVIARHLENHGWPLRVWLLAPHQSRPSNGEPAELEPRLSNDCKINYRIFARSHSDIAFIDTERPTLHAGQMQQVSDEITLGDGWIVDALFGTGLNRALASPFDEIVAAINASESPVLAVDIPSGLDCDTGEPLGPTVRADHTVTFVAWKKGFLQAAAEKWIGQVHITDIGVPKKLVDEYRNRPSGRS